MASNTANLNLYKKDPTLDGNDTFNIKTMLNDNWDKIDGAMAGKVDKGEFNSHKADSTSHITSAERIKWDNKAEKTYVDDQIQTVAATGIPKLVTYEYDLYATVDNQTKFEIPYDHYNASTDTLIVKTSGIDCPKTYYTITDPVTNTDGSITKGFITLTQGRPKDSFLKMRILKNIPIGLDGAIQGTVMAINSIPQNRVQGLVELNNDYVSHKADNTKHVAKDGTIQTGLNVEKLNGKTAGATPLTTEKNDIIAMINENFTNASNGKTSLASVIGSPTVASETFAQIATDIANRKNELVSNLIAKSVTANSSESVQSLVGKVANINTGKKFANGTATSSSSTVTFILTSVGQAYEGFTLNITGLTFKPSTIILKRTQSNTDFRTCYEECSGGIYPKTALVSNYWDATHGSNQNVKGDVLPCKVENGGFVLPVALSNAVYTWYAIE